MKSDGDHRGFFGWHARECVAFFGGATSCSEAQLIAAFEIGRSFAEAGKILLTGATTGAPYAAALGAHEADGFVVGISPAANQHEHRSLYSKPWRQADVLIYTGLGLEGRSPVLARSADAAVVVGGAFGTLAEFAEACTVGTPIIAVLEQSGGVADYLRGLLKVLGRNSACEFIFASDAGQLVHEVCSAMSIRAASRRALVVDDDSDTEVRTTLSRYRRTQSREI